MIYLIITACIQNRYGVQHAEQRKQQYLSAITETLTHLPPTIQPILVENNGIRDTYLDHFFHNNIRVPVVYTTNNARSLSHKAMTELLDIKEVCTRYDIQNNDIIIKLTGRYTVKSPLFFTEVLSDSVTDAFVKFFNVCTQLFDPNDCVLGCYAVRAHLIRYWSHLAMRDQIPERAFAHHIRKNAPIIREMKQLDVECCFADDGQRLRV